MTEQETAKRLRELADEIEEPVDPKPTEPELEWVIRDTGCSFPSIEGPDGIHLRGFTRKNAARIANALNAFKALKEVCAMIQRHQKLGDEVWGDVGCGAEHALRLATLYDHDGRLKDG